MITYFILKSLGISIGTVLFCAFLVMIFLDYLQSVPV